MIKNKKLLQLGLCLIIIIIYLGIGLATLTIADNYRLTYFWLVFLISAIAGIVSVFVVDLDLFSERFKPRGKDDDPYAPPLISLLLMLGLIISALDVGRLHFSNHIPEILQILGLLLQTLGWAGFVWSMAVNRFFSSAIRIQKDRGQVVIATGPYKYIRHPGYATTSLALLAQSIALGSWLGLIPTIILVLVLIKRTIREDAFLVKNLAGYQDYAIRVPWRWCISIW